MIKQTATTEQLKKSSGSRVNRIFRGATMWLSVVLLSIIVSCSVLIAFPFVYLFDRERHSLHSMANGWAKMIKFLNPWWRFKVVGRENLAPNGHPVVYVANHQSQADILALFILSTRFRWLSKASLFNVPFLGWAMSAVGYVPVNRGDKKSGEKCMKQSAKHLKKGTPMVFFPEGTRSKTGEMGKFKIGAFRLAKLMHVPVVPITIDGCADLLPKGSLLPKSAKVTITVHKQIDTTDLEIDDIAQKARDKIASKLPEHLR